MFLRPVGLFFLNSLVRRSGLARPLFYKKTGRGDGLAPAKKALAGRGQTTPFFERKTAGSAGSGLDGKFTSQGVGADNVGQMIVNFFFPDSDRLR